MAISGATRFFSKTTFICSSQTVGKKQAAVSLETYSPCTGRLPRASIIIPVKAFAKEQYKTLNLEETLAEEGIEKKFSNYKETDDQITIYMFRGKGCAYCKKFLEFLNGITEEYGKYFKLVSFESWYNDEYLKKSICVAFVSQLAIQI